MGGKGAAGKQECQRNARAPTANAEQATVAAFLPWRGLLARTPWTLARRVNVQGRWNGKR